VILVIYCTPLMRSVIAILASRDIRPSRITHRAPRCALSVSLSAWVDGDGLAAVSADAHLGLDGDAS